MKYIIISDKYIFCQRLIDDYGLNKNECKIVTQWEQAAGLNTEKYIFVGNIPYYLHDFFRGKKIKWIDDVKEVE